MVKIIMGLKGSGKTKELVGLVCKAVIEGNGVFEWMTKAIYFSDQPNNLFPSIHCMENWVVWRGMVGCKSIPLSVKIGIFVFAILVFLSTLFVKQHVVMDILEYGISI